MKYQLYNLAPSNTATALLIDFQSIIFNTEMNENIYTDMDVHTDVHSLYIHIE